MLFQDAGEQFRYDVYLAWARRIPAAEKRHRPLHDYQLGEEFLPSLAGLDGIDRRKVVDVVVEVLTGLAETLDGREMHVLRSAPAGGAPPLVRDDGAICWRVALHDDFRP